MENITIIKLKALAKQRGIKGYCKIRKAELIQKLEAHPEVNEQVLILGLEIRRNTTRSVNATQFLMSQFLVSQFWITLQYYNPRQNALPEACKRSKILVICCSISHHHRQRCLTKLSNRLRI